MIRFVRSVRRKQWLQGKTLSYILYAIGEIFLIVVGILIAVSIGNWNSNRIEENLRTEYLERLTENIEADSKAYESSKAHAEMRIGFLSLLIEIAKDPQQALAKPVQFMVAVRQSGYFVHPTVSKDTFEELKSTGYLRLFDNDLKELIFRYYTSSDRLGQKKDVSKAVATSFFDAASGVLSYDQDAWAHKAAGRVKPANIPGPNSSTSADKDLELLSHPFDAKDLLSAAERLSKNDRLLSYLSNVRHEQQEIVRANDVLQSHSGHILKLISEVKKRPR